MKSDFCVLLFESRLYGTSVVIIPFSKKVEICKIYTIQCSTLLKDYIFQSPPRVLLFKNTIDRVLFYIKMTVMMSWGPHKGLKLVCQAMVEILVNFVAWVLNKFRNFPWKFGSKNFYLIPMRRYSEKSPQLLDRPISNPYGDFRTS